MDATRLLATFAVAGAFFTVGCGGNSVVKNLSFKGPQCVESVIPDSFLVEWDVVPEIYTSLKVSPLSNITHFKNIDQKTLEDKIIAPYITHLVSAEHDLILEKRDIIPQACSTPVAWGPQDIQAPESWALTGKKGEGVTVAVIDSGLDITHPLISSQVWTNFSEVAGNSLDDDGDGLIDDVNGYNFYSNIADVSDSNQHGTHVSGIIAGQTGPLSFTGVAPKSKIMPLKFIGNDGIGNVGAALSAIQYAYIKGARVINASWGGTDCSDMLKREIQNAVLHGSVFINAAGNAGRDLNFFPEWPAVYQVPGKITVGAMNSGQVLSSFSNYGDFVDIAAPGEGILSLKPGNQLCGLSGTSMATPFVSGVAALLISNKPTLSPVEVINSINNNAVTGRFGVRTQGKLNALRALQSVLP